MNAEPENRLNKQSQKKYLKAMGIQPWYARQVLPGAKPSVITRLKEPEPQVVDVASETFERPKTSGPVDKQSDSPVAVASKQRVVRESVPQVDLISVRCSEQLLIISDVTKQSVEQNAAAQSRLLLELVRAMGVSFEGVKFSHFNWPISNVEHVNQADSAAKDAVWGFYNAHTVSGKARSLLLMGPVTSGYLLPHESQLSEHRGKLWSIGDYSVVVTHSIDAMLEIPSYKREVWQDVQVLSRLLEEHNNG